METFSFIDGFEIGTKEDIIRLLCEQKSIEVFFFIDLDARRSFSDRLVLCQSLNHIN